MAATNVTEDEFWTVAFFLPKFAERQRLMETVEVRRCAPSYSFSAAERGVGASARARGRVNYSD
jgi:hypothetical protein